MIRIFYDLETTGTDPKKNSIVQLAGIVEKDGKVAQSFNIYMTPHPKAKIEPDALTIMKKTEDELKAYPEYVLGFKQFKRILNHYIDPYNKTDKAFLVGFNNRSFDDGFLRKLFELCGDNFFCSYFFSDSIDVSVLASEFLAPVRHMMPSFKLGRVCKELGLNVDSDDLHDAVIDIELTREAYYIVTGRKMMPAKSFFFYVDNESGMPYKTIEESNDPDEKHCQVPYEYFRKVCFEMKVENNNELIKDDLF